MTTVLVAGTASPVRGQSGIPKRFELTPFGGYNWGGSYETSSFATIPAGELQENSSFSWGAILSFLAAGNSAAELYYLRQDTDLNFSGIGTGGDRTVGDFANNYVQLGVRQGLELGQNLKPFITASLGINVLDPKAEDLDTSTRFSWSLGGGGLWMAASQRVGVRLDIRWMVTPVSSGTYGTWCDYWGCYVTEGTTWLHQGSVGAGLVLAF
jgi:hypothetical protein